VPSPPLQRPRRPSAPPKPQRGPTRQPRATPWDQRPPSPRPQTGATTPAQRTKPHNLPLCASSLSAPLRAQVQSSAFNVQSPSPLRALVPSCEPLSAYLPTLPFVSFVVPIFLAQIFLPSPTSALRASAPPCDPNPVNPEIPLILSKPPFIYHSCPSCHSWSPFFCPQFFCQS
jgi:hypothetical protein